MKAEKKQNGVAVVKRKSVKTHEMKNAAAEENNENNEKKIEDEYELDTSDEEVS
jgi:hypothetical protein